MVRRVSSWHHLYGDHGDERGNQTWKEEETIIQILDHVVFELVKIYNIIPRFLAHSHS